MVLGKPGPKTRDDDLEEKKLEEGRGRREG
jgi:hypothetical protein